MMHSRASQGPITTAKSGYTSRQVLSEGGFSAFKRMFGEEILHDRAESFATIMHGIIEGEDTIEGVRAEATYITVGERNALTAFLEGQASSISSALDQQLLMIDTFLDALRNFGLELGKEEAELKAELEEYAEEREKLSSELEDARTKFAKELVNDETGLKFLAGALVGNAEPTAAQWNEFLARERQRFPLPG